MRILLIGNPNCGKTTLFNLLTGQYQKTGNFTGVTTEEKKGFFKKNKDIEIIDLPGIYSLSSVSLDQEKAIEFIKKNKFDKIINVVDGTVLERSLYLTTLLTTLNLPITVAVNMCDEMEKKHLKLNEDKLESLFNVKVVKISAVKKINIDKLMEVSILNDKTPRFINLIDATAIYRFIEDKIDEIVVKKDSLLTVDKIDNVLLNNFLSIPILVIVLSFMFFVTNKVGGYFSNQISKTVDAISNSVEKKFIYNGMPTWFISLSTNALIKGVGAVFSFLPQILILFFFLTIIEESGYASRIAYILDRTFKCLNLSGKAVIPLLVASGCSVSGIMATRTIENEKERKKVIFLLPFVPCGAKMALFSWLSIALFKGSVFISVSLYLLSFFVIIVLSKFLFKKSAFDGDFIIEIPPLRMPRLKDVFFVLTEKIKEFMLKAGSVIFIVSLVIWGLSNFNFYGYNNGKIEESFLYLIGDLIKYIFYPLGFLKKEIAISLLSGILAKEGIVEALKMLTPNVKSLFDFSFTAYSFLTFILFSPPCVATLSIIRKEVGEKSLFKMILSWIIIAYLVALSINLIGFIYYYNSYLILLVILVIILLLKISITFYKKSFNFCTKSCKRKGIKWKIKR